MGWNDYWNTEAGRDELMRRQAEANGKVQRRENDRMLRELQKQPEQERLRQWADDIASQMTVKQRKAFDDETMNAILGWWPLLQGLVVAVIAGFQTHSFGVFFVLIVVGFVGASLMWHTTRRSGAFLKWSTFVIVTALGITTVFVGWSLGGFGIAALGAFISLGPVGSSFADLRRHRS